MDLHTKSMGKYVFGILPTLQWPMPQWFSECPAKQMYRIVIHVCKIDSAKSKKKSRPIYFRGGHLNYVGKNIF